MATAVTAGTGGFALIVAIDGDYVTIKTSGGHERSCQIVGTTTFVRGKRAGVKSDLKIGPRLVVNVGEGDGAVEGQADLIHDRVKQRLSFVGETGGQTLIVLDVSPEHSYVRRR